MGELFSSRFNIPILNKEIIVRNDAPEELREYLLELVSSYSIRYTKIRKCVCGVLQVARDPNNWGENEHMYAEIRSNILDCPWYKVYDLIESFFSILNASEKNSFEKKINQYFLEHGIGWQLTNGVVEMRGDEFFEGAVSEIENLMDERKLNTSRNEITEAISDLSKRPNPDITGSVQHALAALECLSREITGNTTNTLGKLINDNPNLVPAPLNIAISKIYGFASNNGRHLNEGVEPNLEEAELLVHLSSCLCSYLCKKYIKPKKDIIESNINNSDNSIF